MSYWPLKLKKSYVNNIKLFIMAHIHVTKLTYVCLFAQLALDIGTQTRVKMLEFRQKGGIQQCICLPMSSAIVSTSKHMTNLLREYQP